MLYYFIGIGAVFIIQNERPYEMDTAVIYKFLYGEFCLCLNVDKQIILIVIGTVKAAIIKVYFQFIHNRQFTT